jgi:radical SAM protein with 4Fe4S-binding SPASM domain
MMEALEHRRPLGHYCPAGLGTLCVAADGGLYPCFMLVGQPGLRIGTVTPEGELVDARRNEVAAALRGCLKGSRGCCRDCWAAPFCSGCIGSDLIETGELCQPARCDMTRTIARTILLELASDGPAPAQQAQPQLHPRCLPSLRPRPPEPDPP